MEKKVTLTLREETCTIDGEKIDYVAAYADIDGISIKFYPADKTAKQIVKAFVAKK